MIFTFVIKKKIKSGLDPARLGQLQTGCSKNFIEGL
jgi:hypothetical protein